MKRNTKRLILKAVTVVLTAILFIFLYGFLIGGALGIWFLIIGFFVLFISMSFFVTETDRKELFKRLVTNTIICIVISIISLFVYEGINTLQVKETKTYYSTVTGHYGNGGRSVRFLDETGVEQSAYLNDYSLVTDADYFEEGEKIIVTEKLGMFGAPFFSVEEVKK